MSQQHLLFRLLQKHCGDFLLTGLIICPQIPEYFMRACAPILEKHLCRQQCSDTHTHTAWNTETPTVVLHTLLIRRSRINFSSPPLAALASPPPWFPCTLLLLAPVIPLIRDTHSFSAIAPSRLSLLCHAVILTYRRTDINMLKSRGRTVM